MLFHYKVCFSFLYIWYNKGRVIRVSKIRNLLTRKYTKTEATGIIFSIVAVGIVIDLLLLRFSIFFIALSIFLIAIGYQRSKLNKSSYILIALGTGFLLFALFTSVSFSLIFATLIIYNSYHLFKSSTRKSKIDLNIKSDPKGAQTYIQIDPYFKNKLVGEFRHLEESYILDDINIQTGFGDILIDLSNTIIPEGETVILIRGVVGNIYLNIPSDIGMSLQMSLLFGKMNLLADSKNAFNLTKKYQSVDYKNSSRKVKFVATLLIGDIEVKH